MSVERHWGRRGAPSIVSPLGPFGQQTALPRASEPPMATSKIRFAARSALADNGGGQR